MEARIATPTVTPSGLGPSAHYWSIRREKGGATVKWSASSGQLKVAYREGIAVLSIDRPDKLGAMTPTMLEDLAGGVRVLGADAEIRGIVLSGTGRAFSAGGDLDWMRGASAESLDDFMRLFNEVTLEILAAPVPVVVALDGLAVGGAAEMVLSADARLGSAQAEYFFPDNGLGVTLSGGASYLLGRIVGQRALPLILGSERIGADEALRIGLLDRIVDGDVVAEAIELVDRWAAAGSASAFHLRLLRAPIEQVREAIDREVDISRSARVSGVSALGLAR
jgi:enoyl-CoA hydratase